MFGSDPNGILRKFNWKRRKRERNIKKIGTEHDDIMTQDHDTWQWQEPGETWRGAGLYHVTLTIPSRQPLLGDLVIPDNDPTKAWINYSDFGRAVLEYQKVNADYYPEIQILHYCLMPDHLHAVWYVRKAMPRGISAAVRGFWQGAKKAGRAYSYLSSIIPESDSGEQKKTISGPGEQKKLTHDIAEHLRVVSII